MKVSFQLTEVKKKFIDFPAFCFRSIVKWHHNNAWLELRVNNVTGKLSRSHTLHSGGGPLVTIWIIPSFADGPFSHHSCVAFCKGSSSGGGKIIMPE